MLRQLGERVMWNMTVMAERHPIVLPDHVTMMPIYFKGDFSMCNGLFKRRWGRYCVCLSVPDCLQSQKRAHETVDHECAHFALVLRENYWGHGQKFSNEYEFLRSYPREIQMSTHTQT